MYFIKYFAKHLDENFVKTSKNCTINIEKKRNFANVKNGLKPSSLRIKCDKKNFNDIINKYFPNRLLKKKNILRYKYEEAQKKYYLCPKMERKVQLQESNKDRKRLENENSENDHLLKEGFNCIKVDTSIQIPKKEDIKKDSSCKGKTYNLNTVDASNELLEITKEEYDIQKYKNKLHKKIWLTLKKNNEKEFQYYYNILDKYPLKDEVSYSILLHGKLIITSGENISESFKILNEMKLKKVHCSLIRFNERLLHSYYELKKLNSIPNNTQWIKVLRTVWFTSALVKARRQKYILRKIKNIKKHNSASLSNFNHIFNIHNLEALYMENKDPLIGKNFKQIS